MRVQQEEEGEEEEVVRLQLNVEIRYLQIIDTKICNLI